MSASWKNSASACWTQAAGKNCSASTARRGNSDAGRGRPGMTTPRVGISRRRRPKRNPECYRSLSFDSCAEARQRLLAPGLALCYTSVDKIALLTQFVEQTKAFETAAQVRLEARKGTESAIHRLRYQRLDAEIQLRQT